MDCSRFRDRYCDYADGLMDEAAEIAMIRHLAECAACRRMDAAFQAGIGALRCLEPVRASDDFDLRLEERILRDCAGARIEPAGRLRVLVSVAGTVVLVATAALVGWELRDLDAPASTTARTVRSPREPSSPVPTRLVHDTSYGRDPFRVLPPASDARWAGPRRMDITVDWMVP